MMTSPKPKPTGITLNKTEAYLEITWNIDEEVSRYPLPQLREACPCVECRGGHAYMTPAYDPKNLLTIPLTPARAYGIKDIHVVGNYALDPVWEDGHSTGIYTWEYLYKLRPIMDEGTS
jgi:DUF971 family protein